MTLVRPHPPKELDHRPQTNLGTFAEIAKKFGQVCDLNLGVHEYEYLIECSRTYLARLLSDYS
jgi:hypothetical protein